MNADCVLVDVNISVKLATPAESVPSAAPSPDRDQLFPRPEEQRAVRHRRRRQAGLMQFIGTYERVLVSRHYYKHDALFAGEIDMPPVRYGRRGEPLAARAKTLGVLDRTRRRVKASHFSPVTAPEQQVPDGDGGLHIIAPRGMRPGDGGVGLARVVRPKIARS